MSWKIEVGEFEGGSCTNGEKMTDKESDQFALYMQSQRGDNSGVVKRRINVFLEDGRSKHAVFTPEEWGQLHAIMGRAKVMELFFTRELTDEQIAGIKKTIKESLEA